MVLRRRSQSSFDLFMVLGSRFGRPPSPEGLCGRFFLSQIFACAYKVLKQLVLDTSGDIERLYVSTLVKVLPNIP
jgi:hypothetical protein